MNCKEVQNLLTPFMLKEGDPALRQQIMYHLQECTACYNMQASLIKPTQLLQEDLTDLFSASQIMDQIKHSAIRPRFQLRWYHAAAVVLLVAGLVFVGQMVFVKPDQPLVQVVEGNLQVSNDRVSSESGQRGTVKLYDGSKVGLSEKTELVVEKPAAGRIVHLARGEATFDVVEKSERFQVKTSLACITVLGTEFKVSIKGEEIMKSLTVLVLAGMVHIQNSFGDLPASSGDTVVVKQERRPIKLDTSLQDSDIACKSCLEKWGGVSGHSVQSHYVSNKCRLCGMKPREACKDLHKDKIQHLKYCLDCAKKEKACPICGDKIDQPKIDEEDKKWINEGACTAKSYDDYEKDRAKACCGFHGEDKMVGATCERCGKEYGDVGSIHSPCRSCAKEIGICYHCHRKVSQEIKDSIWWCTVCFRVIPNEEVNDKDGKCVHAKCNYEARSVDGFIKLLKQIKGDDKPWKDMTFPSASLCNSLKGELLDSLISAIEEFLKSNAKVIKSCDKCKPDRQCSSHYIYSGLGSLKESLGKRKVAFEGIEGVLERITIDGRGERWKVGDTYLVEKAFDITELNEKYKKLKGKKVRVKGSLLQIWACYLCKPHVTAIQHSAVLLEVQEMEEIGSGK